MWLKRISFPSEAKQQPAADMRPILCPRTSSPGTKEKLGNLLRKTTTHECCLESTIAVKTNLRARGCVRVGC
ncbi:hypothetical protein E2C01_059584 [Portunus trituberculatus]|uniref:Uncharacterized protein n=1 Tax=Portunus trituberculatus TaxID=210409 RepID=A0A5B7GZK8_PORTR|nr:hypothetical protein [Portunus trituberculatus]